MVAVARADRGTARQVIDVTVRGGYQPAVVEARAGVPLRLVFHRQDPDACSERVIFSSPHIDRRLAPGAATVVDLPAQTEGEVRYTCGMGRYRGRIRFVADAPRPAIARLLGERQGGLALGAILGLCGLPLVVLVGYVVFGAGLWPAMGIALLAWLVGCLLMGALLEPRGVR